MRLCYCKLLLCAVLIIRPIQFNSLFPISLPSKMHAGGVVHYSLPDITLISEQMNIKSFTNFPKLSVTSTTFRHISA